MRQETQTYSILNELVQSRGALLSIEKGSEIFVAASENAHIFAGSLTHEELLGRSVLEWLGRPVAHALRNAEAQPSLEHRRVFLGKFELAAGFCDLTVFSSGDQLILEIQPSAGERIPGAFDILKDVQFLSDVLFGVGGPHEIMEKLVSLLKTISGFHCVTVDVAAGGSFETFAVAGREEFASASGLAPPQLHAVEDVDARTVRISALSKVVPPGLELSLLSVPPERVLNDMRRAGIAAFAAARLDSGGEICGRLRFLHGTSRVPNKRTELTLAHIAPLVGARLAGL